MLIGSEFIEPHDRGYILLHVISVEPGDDDGFALLVAVEEILALDLRQVERLGICRRGDTGQQPKKQRWTNDCPDGSQLTPVRGASVTSLQALSMLNDKFIVRQTEHMAERAALRGADPEQRVAAIYRRILGRAPTPKEAQAVSAYVARHGLANACRMLLNSNEFVFVD